MIIDIIFLIILIIFLILGFINGFILEFLNLISIFVSIYLLPKAFNFVKMFNIKYLDNFNDYLLYIILFIIIYLIFKIISQIINKFVLNTALNFVNRLLGAAVGALKASLIIFIVFIILILSKDSFDGSKKMLENSQVTMYVSIYLGPYNKLFPEFVQKKLDEYMYQSKKQKLVNNIINKIEKGINND